MTNYSLILSNFLKSSSKLQLVSRLPKLSTSTAYHYYILDSSFNPPHYGHLSIINKSLINHSHENQVVVLMLSINNVDKLPTRETFDHRLKMMELFSKEIKSEKILICLTKCGKFVDKYFAFSQFLTNNQLKFEKLSFLMGYDTIIRLFDAKYYSPQTIIQALSDFLNNCDIICLGRFNNEELISYKNQLKAILSNDWVNKIKILNSNDEFILNLSSSEIRKNLQSVESLDFLENAINNDVLQLIKNNEFYK